MKRSILILLVLANAADASSWHVKPAGSIKSHKTCGDDIDAWVMTVAKQQPTIVIDGDHIALRFGTSTPSSRALVGNNYAIGFWDESMNDDNSVTFVVRLQRKTDALADVSIMVIKRRSLTDRGDACYVEWRGEAER